MPDPGLDRVDELAIAAGEIQDDGVLADMALQKFTTEGLSDEPFPRQILVQETVPVESIEHRKPYLGESPAPNQRWRAKTSLSRGFDAEVPLEIRFLSGEGWP
jgi:hypothetical protein